MTNENLTPEQQAIVDLFDRHVRAEFELHDVDVTMATMTAAPHLNHVPVMTGGRDRAEIQNFYARHFIPGLPPDAGNEMLSRTVGQGRLVMEIILTFTHTIEMPWILPGVKPTGRRVEVPVVLVVHVKDDKVDSEHIYWDQASVLVQVGLLSADKLPVAGVEQARKMRKPTVEPSNRLIERS
ncbi:MAG: nuclear transport factor 2 family protein [Alphaproteobacteria bacterium]|nr:nuclear transport factor 2 family protein [Alphaproteobacteria bacterium]